MEILKGASLHFVGYAAPVFSAIGTAALVMLGRQVPDQSFVVYCAGTALGVFALAKLARTIRNRRELCMRNVLEQTTDLYNASPSGIILCTETGAIKNVNDTLLESISSGRQDVEKRRNINDLLSSASRKKFWGFVELSKRNIGWVRNVTLDFIESSGRSKSLLSNICYELDGSGNASIKCTTADVSEGRATETVLAEMRMTFRRFAEQLDNVGVLRCELDGRINFASSNACLILLRRHVDLLGFNVRQFYAPEEADSFAQDIKSAQEMPDRKYSVTRKLLRGNDSFQAKISIVFAQTENGTPGIIFVVTDLGEKALREEWLANIIATRESTLHLGWCLANMIDHLCDLLYVHQPGFATKRFQPIEGVPSELAELSQSFSNTQVFAELLNFSVATLKMLMHQLSKSIVARDVDNVLMISSLIEMMGIKLKQKRIEQACCELSREVDKQAWQQIELCAAIVKKEVESLQIAAEGMLHTKSLDLAIDPTFAAV